MRTTWTLRVSSPASNRTLRGIKGRAHLRRAEVGCAEFKPTSLAIGSKITGLSVQGLPIGSIVVPFCGSSLGSYKVIPKSNYYGAYGQGLGQTKGGLGR